MAGQLVGRNWGSYIVLSFATKYGLLKDMER